MLEIPPPDALPAGFTIEALRGPVPGSDLDELVRVHADAVASGASVSFMHDTPPADYRRFWDAAAVSIERGTVLLVARDAGGIAGTVQLQPAWAPNQPHRAEIAKLLVHRRVRRRGLGEVLMREVEARAKSAGFTLLTLDTTPGDNGDRLYRRLGWVEAGRIPGFACYPDGSLCDTVLFYKRID